MKKHLLLALSFSMAAASWAAPFEMESVTVAPVPQSFQQKSTPRTIMRATTDKGYDLSFCGSIYSYGYLDRTDKLDYHCYIYITPEVATQLAGNTLDAIRFSMLPMNPEKSLQGYVFVSENINAEPVTKTDVTIEPGAVLSGGYITETYYQTGTLATPYTIKENTGFYMGVVAKDVRYTRSYSDYVVCYDQGPATPFAGYVSLYQAGQYLRSLDMAQQGMNLCIQGVTTGPKKGIYDLAMVEGALIDEYTLPIVTAGTPMPVTLGITNLGDNAITSLEVSFKLDGKEQVTTAAVNVPSRSTDAVEIPLPFAIPEGPGTIDFSVKKINTAEASFTAELDFVGLPEGKGFERNFVVEEVTGTWCGYCPMGIVGLDAMNKVYPDKFIGIAAHFSNGSALDPLQADSYIPIMDYFTGFPSCIVNRDPYWNFQPITDNLNLSYRLWMAYPLSNAKVDFTVTHNTTANTLDIKANSSFAVSQADADYSIAFVIRENGLKAEQTNYFAGGDLGPMGGWENKGMYVNWTYDDTARDIFDYAGIPNSIPASVEAGKSYPFETSLALTNVSNVANTNVVALVLDQRTGVIVNASVVKAADYNSSGISDVIGDTSEPSVISGKGCISVSEGAVVYNLAGQRVAATPGAATLDLNPGLYIVKTAGSAVKALVK